MTREPGDPGDAPLGHARPLGRGGPRRALPGLRHDLLRHPGPPGRGAEDAGRGRARPDGGDRRLQQQQHPGAGPDLRAAAADLPHQRRRPHRGTGPPPPPGRARTTRPRPRAGCRRARSRSVSPPAPRRRTTWWARSWSGSWPCGAARPTTWSPPRAPRSAPAHRISFRFRALPGDPGPDGIVPLASGGFNAAGRKARPRPGDREQALDRLGHRPGGAPRGGAARGDLPGRAPRGERPRARRAAARPPRPPLRRDEGRGPRRRSPPPSARGSAASTSWSTRWPSRCARSSTASS